MRAIVGVTEHKAEFGGMLDLHKRFGFCFFLENHQHFVSAPSTCSLINHILPVMVY